MKPPRYILPVIVIAQFCCTSLWFASNGVIEDIVNIFGFKNSATAYLTSAVQLGFITGTISFAIFCVVDRISPSKVFFLCAILGAIFNGFILWGSNSIYSMILFRFLTGLSLAGIYPVGMKIASDYYQKGLGKSLGYLVGALVLGTAIPHLLKGFVEPDTWYIVIIITSGLAVLGGIIVMIFVPDGPFRSRNEKVNLLAFFEVFKVQNFRNPAFGYFGHMWELYAFWTFTPLMLQYYAKYHNIMMNVSLLSFCIIAIGSLSCIASAHLTQKYSTINVAKYILITSGFCCLVSPILFQISSPIVYVSFFMTWGMFVIADSPLFSTLVAHNAPIKLRGTALTIVNGVGFLITILSIQLLDYLSTWIDYKYLLVVLILGPVFGVYHLGNPVQIKE